MPYPTLIARLCLIPPLLLASACAHYRCEALLTSTAPDALDYQINFEQRLIVRQDDEALPAEQRLVRHEATLNQYLTQTLGKYHCSVIKDSLTIGFLGPGRNAWVRCAAPVPVQPEKRAFQPDGRPIYRYCLSPRAAAPAVQSR